MIKVIQDIDKDGKPLCRIEHPNGTRVFYGTKEQYLAKRLAWLEALDPRNEPDYDYDLC